MLLVLGVPQIGFQAVVSNIFIFTPILGEMIQFDEHIFQMGWFNHQLGLGGVDRLEVIYFFVGSKLLQRLPCGNPV